MHIFQNQQVIIVNSLKNIWTEFIDKTRLYPYFGAELEFYIEGITEIPEAEEEIIGALKSFLSEEQPEVIRIDKERGAGQYEIIFGVFQNPVHLAKLINECRNLVSSFLENICLTANFDAKPYPQDYGSGLHFHLSLHDKNGVNQYVKTSDGYSDLMRYSIGGLLNNVSDFMNDFFPHKKSYNRLVAGMNAPVNASWGGNNRTVMLRIPESPASSKRIEHRLAGSDAQPEKIMAAILYGALDGIISKTEPSEQIFGDASLAQYGLEGFNK